MDVTAYLERIGVARPAAADLSLLRALHRAHQTAVPFENLSIHLGERVSLTEESLFDKIVRRRRGGFCYELNGAFAMVLEELGYAVRLAGARVYGPDRLGPPFDHMALLVSTPDGAGPWLVDVGFGRHSTYPLRFADRDEQVDPAGRYTLTDTPDGDVDVLKDGVPQYRVEPRTRTLTDFVPTCWWHETSPDSHFTRSTVCSRLDGDDGRISISGRTLIRTDGTTRTEKTLETDEELRAAYLEHFGITLDRLPVVSNPR
jgi:N-hydroxyarylamine O-acetyltransferase